MPGNVLFGGCTTGFIGIFEPGECGLPVDMTDAMRSQVGCWAEPVGAPDLSACF